MKECKVLGSKTLVEWRSDDTYVPLEIKHVLTLVTSIENTEHFGRCNTYVQKNERDRMR